MIIIYFAADLFLKVTHVYLIMHNFQLLFNSLIYKWADLFTVPESTTYRDNPLSNFMNNTIYFDTVAIRVLFKYVSN